MPSDARDQYFPDLSPAQAEGLACVICARPLLVSLPLGRSLTGSQVFACAEACTQTATAPGAVLIPDEALTAAGAAFLAALQTAGGDLHRAWPDDLVTATVTTAAPLIVAAELRWLAELFERRAADAECADEVLRQWSAVHECADTARARADLLNPAGGGERR
jgi:hypothetical protein